MPSTVSARIAAQVTLQTHDGRLIACFAGQSVNLGAFHAAAGDRALELRKGLPLCSLAPQSEGVKDELHLLVRRLAARGLLEYGLGRLPDGEDQIVIEPQNADYWPQTPRLGDAEILVLSRFAYMRRRGDAMVLESPRANALFKIRDPRVAAAIATLSTPQHIDQFRRQDDFPGDELLALLMDCRMLFSIDGARDINLRAAEGDEDLVLWDFHDLLFHARSTEGRHASPLGGVYPYADVMRPQPAVRPRWPGKKVGLGKFSAAQATSPFAELLRKRHSTRDFDDQQPVTLPELSLFLAQTARVTSKWKHRADLGGGGPMVEYAARPYPSAGGAYELEFYLAVNQCEGLARGFYHYDAGGQALVAIEVGPPEFEALLAGAEFAMGARATPQVLITIAARFSRLSWKYSSIAYALALKNAGVAIQTLYLVSADMGLGGCAIGSVNIDLFAKMTGIEFHVEGPVAQFAVGREPRPRIEDQSSGRNARSDEQENGPSR